MFNKTLSLEDFAEMFGADDIPERCKELIYTTDFRYREPTVVERDSIILSVLKKIEEDKQIIGAVERKEVWENGWAENLTDFIKDSTLDSLVPKFVRKGQAIRYKQNYIIPASDTFELDCLTVLFSWLFLTYFSNYNPIYEFGCGTGFNLVMLSKLFPEKTLRGSDFVPSAVELINRIGKTYDINLTGFLFDMITPDTNIKLEKGSGVFTSGAMEQLAGKFEDFLQYLLSQSPKICIHIEPTLELYDNSNLIDYLALKFYRKRGYTQGYLPRLQELEKQGKIEIIKVKRTYFGSLYMEGYMCIIWKVK